MLNSRCGGRTVAIGPSGAADKLRVVIPPPSGEGIVQSEKSAARKDAVPVPSTAEEARRVIALFESGARSVRGDDAVADSVAQHVLSDRTGLGQEQWLGTPFEERDAYV